MKRLKLHTDHSELEQPPNTYRYANNVLISENLGTLLHESGTTLLETFPTGTIFLGFAPISENGLVIFSIQGTNNVINLYYDYDLTTLLSEPNLGFDEAYLIQADTTKLTNVDWVVVWTDNLNPPRYSKFTLP